MDKMDRTQEAPDKFRSDMSDTDVLLDQIEQACRQLKIAQTTFGRLAVNDGKLVNRLQQGARVTLATVNRVHQFIEEQGAATAASLRSGIRGLNIAPSPVDFRLFDNRQKHLMFVNATSEKQEIAKRALQEMDETQPQPPALRVMDACAGDGTALAQILRGLHRRLPSVPLYVVAREAHAQNARLILEKMADRMQEHPSTVFVLTNFKYPEAPRLKPRTPATASRMIWNEVPLAGTTADEFEQQIMDLGDWLGKYWQSEPGADFGKPIKRSPVVLVLFRRDQRFALDAILPKRGLSRADFDFVLAAQPFRARASLEFKVSRVIAPLARSLRANGKLMVVQSFGKDAGTELINRIWPDERPFVHGRAALLEGIERELGSALKDFRLQDLPDQQSVFPFVLRTSPGEISPDVPMSNATVLSAWNAACYVSQIDDGRAGEIMAHDHIRQVTREVLLSHGGLAFNNEAFIITRKPSLD